ncbi:MAG: metalloregulator ArsR/SmtB family transcription factor [Planctomycetota bacterium]|nr:metalloregulator ArsR/SmtB family transcription factor [Planctomycetota bacterium]
MSISSKHLPDDTMIAHMAEIFQIMGDESRLKILRSLMSGALSVNEIVAGTGQSQANVSKHLSLLTRSGMLARRKEGTRVWYSIKDPMVIALCDAVCQNRAGAMDSSLNNSIETFKTNT